MPTKSQLNALTYMLRGRFIAGKGTRLCLEVNGELVPDIHYGVTIFRKLKMKGLCELHEDGGYVRWSTTEKGRLVVM